MKRRSLETTAVFLALAAFAPAAWAQITLDWHTFDGGGEMFSTSRTIRLGGTIGQPDAGPTLTGGDIALTGGFWVVIHAAPADCPSDLNHDGLVNLTDLSMLLTEFGCVAGCTADIDGDQQVTLTDLAILLTHFGEVCG